MPAPNVLAPQIVGQKNKGLISRLLEKMSTKSSPTHNKIPQIIDLAGFMFARCGATRRRTSGSERSFTL